MPESIAVVIPSYNRAQSLERCIASVLVQDRQADEIIVVDDGSTDGTAELLEAYPQVIYRRQNNCGVSAARNAGIRASSCDWIAFLDSDDEWLPEKLEKQLAAVRKQPGYRLVHSDEIWIRRGVRVNPMRKHAKAGGDIFFNCLPLCVISPSAVLVQRSLLGETGCFDENLPACEDYDLWLRICSHYPVLYLDEPLLIKYGGHPDQLSRKHWGMDRFRVQALDKLLQAGGLTAMQEEAVRNTLRDKCKILLQGALRHKNEGLVFWVQKLLKHHDLVTES